MIHRDISLQRSSIHNFPIFPPLPTRDPSKLEAIEILLDSRSNWSKRGRCIPLPPHSSLLSKSSTHCRVPSRFLNINRERTIQYVHIHDRAIMVALRLPGHSRSSMGVKPRVKSVTLHRRRCVLEERRGGEGEPWSWEERIRGEAVPRYLKYCGRISARAAHRKLCGSLEWPLSSPWARPFTAAQRTDVITRGDNRPRG